MVGITSYGAYIPMLRLPLAMIGGGKPGGPEKAVANWDEDGLTMAVASAIACLEGVDRATVDGVLFASTSYAFKEKQGAAIVAKALDLRRDVVTADLGDSLRAGTTALAARGEPRRRRGRVPPRRHRRRREPRGGACGGRRDHRRLAARGRPVRALVGGPLRRRPWLPPERARRGARPPREDGPCDAGLREARALRAGRAEPRHGGARDRVRARAGAGPAL